MYLWDPTNNGSKPVARLLGHQNKVNHVQFSPDGTLIASAGWDNHTVRSPDSRAFSLRGPGTDSNDAETLERQRRQVPQKPKGPRRAGRSLRSATQPHPPRTALLLTPELQVYQCSWSADSRLLVTGSKDCTLKVWNARSGSLAMDLPGHEDEVCMQSARECTALLSRAERLLTQEIARSTPWTGPPTGRWSVRAGRTRLCGRGGTEVVCPWRWYYGEERKPMIPCPCRAARKGADLMLNSAQLLISLVCVGASTSCVGRWSAELVAGYRCAAA